MVVDWTGTNPQVKGAINNTLSFTKAASYTRRALGAAARHPEQRGRVPRHRGDLPARHGRQRRAAGRLRGARPDRLPHGRLHVRRARDDAARQGQGGGRWRQHRHLDRRLRRRPQAVRLCRLHLRRLGRAAMGRRARRQFAHVRQHGLALDRGDRGRASDPAARLRVRRRQGGRRQISRRRAVQARLPLPRSTRACCRCAPTGAITGRSASMAAVRARRRRTTSIPTAENRLLPSQAHHEHQARRRVPPCARGRRRLGRSAGARSRGRAARRAQRASLAGQGRRGLRRRRRHCALDGRCSRDREAARRDQDGARLDVSSQSPVARSRCRSHAPRNSSQCP